jgi:sucrose phosphorylase
MQTNKTPGGIGPMLNAYPDSIGGDLSSIVSFLRKPEVDGAFTSMYILPSLYDTDLDRGFSVQDYDINGVIATEDDLKELREMGIGLKLDFILNHLSVRSPQFRDLLANGSESKYKDFFIDWNAFWEGKGEMTKDGYIEPDPEYIKDMFFRKPGLPIMMVPFPDGRKVPYWNTFYQEIIENPDGTTDFLGQMDLNVAAPVVWEHYEETLEKLAGYGAEIIRLDAFAYAPKAPGRRNFLNEPETWELLERIQGIADRYGLSLLPEIHATYGEGTYRTLADKGYHVYDFFLPGLIIDALDSGDAGRLAAWADEIISGGIKTVNMLGCHDGIPVLDLKGMIPEERIEELVELLKSRGGFVKDLHAKKKLYYQVNATYLSALGGDEDDLVLARAIQLFMPGKPQIWYLDLLAGQNDIEAVERAGSGGHKEINRTNLSMADAETALAKDSVKKQLELLKLRAAHPAFSPEADIKVSASGPVLTITWDNGDDRITLEADLKSRSYKII